MATHCREEHKWKNPRGRGRYTAPNQNSRIVYPWTTKQAAQRFFRTGKWQRYFPVEIDGTSNSQNTNNPSPEQIVQQGQSILDGFFQGSEQAKKDDTSNQQRRRCEPNPWLEHTMWESHIGPHKEWAVRMSKEVSSEEVESGDGQPVAGESQEADEEAAAANTVSEEALEQACKATRSSIRRAYQVSRIEIVGRPSMMYINRREAGAVSNDRPFYGKQKVQTIRKYSDRFVRILRYIWRTEAVEKRPEYCLTNRQQTELKELRRQAARIAQRERSMPTPDTVEFIQQSRRQIHRRGRLVNQCITFWIAMFDHQLKDNEFESAIISGLAVLGADGENGGWMPAINYTPILAAMITTMRAIVIRRAWRIRQDEIKKQIENGMPERHARQQARSVLATVKEDVHAFMTSMEFGGHPTPLNTIYIHKMYGMKIRYTTNAEGQVSWEGDDTVLVRKIKFSMDDIRTIVHGLVNVMRRQLVEELLILNPSDDPREWKPESLPKFDNNQVADNHRVLDEGWSFLKDVRNKWAVDGERWMGMRLFDDGPVRDRFIRSQDGTFVEWNHDAVTRYLRAIKKFKERLIVLVHMSAGAPARSTELTSIQCENGKYARSQRGIFVDNGLVAFVTAYHKGFSASQSMKIIHRFVPREVGEIVIYYVWLIRPFERILQGLAQHQQWFSPWLWEPEHEEEFGPEDDIGADDQDEGYMSEEEEKKESNGGGPVEEWDDIGQEEMAEIQAHAVPKPTPQNCDGFWDTNRVRRVMRRETADRCGVAIGISDWRQVYPAIHREHAIDQSIRETLTKIYENDNPNAKADDPPSGNPSAIFRAKQSGHSPQMEESIYGRLLDQSPATTTAEKDAYRRVSVDWHRFLQFPSALEVESVDPDVRRRIKREQDNAQFHRFEQMRNVDVEAELRRMYHNPTATFRGAQREALELIVGGCPRAVIIMRTGGGKSLLFMLPAAASKGGVTIVVVPKIALQANMKQRCMDAGIKCAVWSDDRAPPYDAQIVFVIAESAVSQSFADFINAKKSNHQLERIVIDECHTILQCHEKWRPKVLQLRELAGRDTQVICLTATLPPQKQEDFLDRMDMRVEGLKILRDRTVRPNIGYSVEEYDEEEEVEFLRELVERKKAQYPASDKIVIYCRTIDQVKQFARELDCTAFWRTAGTEKEKAEILNQLTGGTERVFTSTNALGEGIDAPTVRVVIHVGVVDSLDDYGQQSGRAGRDGVTASEAIMLRKFRVGKDGRRRPEEGWKVEPEMKEFWRGRKCKRVVMDEYMDGETKRTTCQPGEQFCDVCRGRGAKRVRVVDASEGAEPAFKRRCGSRRGEGLQQQGGGVQQQSEWQSRREFEQEGQQFAAIESRRRSDRIEQGTIADQIEALFDEWKVECSICRVYGRQNEDQHQWRQCPYGLLEMGLVEKVKKHLVEVRWSTGYICCRQCWAPQAICHSFEPIDSTGRMRYRKGQGKCQFIGVLLEAVAIMMAADRKDAITNWIEEKAQQAGTTEQERGSDWEGIVKPWLGSRISRGGVEMSGMCYLFWQWAANKTSGAERNREVGEERGYSGWLF